jgi:hypothetical protein
LTRWSESGDRLKLFAIVLTVLLRARAVGAERRGDVLTLMPLEGDEARPLTAQIPHPRRVVSRRRDHIRAVGAERRGGDRTLMPLEGLREGFSARYTRAREIQAMHIADELLSIADDGSNDWMEREKGGYDLNTDISSVPVLGSIPASDC